MGRSATSRRFLDTSIPTVILPIMTLPCLIGLRALRPWRLFGFNGLTGGASSSPTVFKDPGRNGPPPVTATPTLSESGNFKLQGRPRSGRVRGVRADMHRFIQRARKLRHSQTSAEARLWQAVRNRQLARWKFRRQHPIDKYVVDFVTLDGK